MQFWLGTHHPNWLSSMDTLFVSNRRLTDRKTLPVAKGAWALDSGGFSELSMYGAWRTTPEEYVAKVDRYAAEIGNLQWAAIQDWMCEPFMLTKTGLTLEEHQRRTIGNYERLLTLRPSFSWVPVLQGWQLQDYESHLRQYEDAGFRLTELPLVGIGSVCRRQAMAEAEYIVRTMASYGLRLHGFGVKLLGLERMADVLASADSLAWSYTARRALPLPDCHHRNCANCPRYAAQWRERVQASLDSPKPHQLPMMGVA